MNYQLLGKSGLRVSDFCLGTMTFGDQWHGWGMATGREESRAIFDSFAAAGGNFIDTANGYNAGGSEQFLGEFIRPERDRFVLATKYGMTMRPADPNAGGNHRKNLVHSLEASLRRLGTDYIDLFWLHAWDFTTPVEEVMRGLDDMVRSGKVLYVGVSDTPAWIVSRANTLAELRGWTSFVGLQVQYSLIERTAERDLLPMARELDLGVTAWSPLGMGLLTGKYNGRTAAADAASAKRGRLDLLAGSGESKLTARNLAIAAEVQNVARELGHTSSQVALNWVRQNGAIPIVGARHVDQLKETLAAAELRLPEEAVRRLETASRVDLGFPHEFLASIKNVILGEAGTRLRNHRRAA